MMPQAEPRDRNKPDPGVHQTVLGGLQMSTFYINSNIGLSQCVLAT